MLKTTIIGIAAAALVGVSAGPFSVHAGQGQTTQKTGEAESSATMTNNNMMWLQLQTKQQQVKAAPKGAAITSPALSGFTGGPPPSQQTPSKGLYGISDLPQGSYEK